VLVARDPIFLYYDVVKIAVNWSFDTLVTNILWHLYLSVTKICKILALMC
jgi:hypothetical protein